MTFSLYTLPRCRSPVIYYPMSHTHDTSISLNNFSFVTSEIASFEEIRFLARILSRYQIRIFIARAKEFVCKKDNGD